MSKTNDLSALLHSLLSSIEWHDFSSEEPEGCDNILECPFLVLTIMNSPQLEVAYWNGVEFMTNDDWTLAGPVKCVELWAMI